MPMRQQKWATRAYDAVSQRKGTPIEEEYARICKTFPALLHGCGLCQAVAFAEAKGADKGKDKGLRTEFGQYLHDLAVVLGMDQEELSRRSRRDEVLSYQRLSQDTLAAASWLKRYAEALLKDSLDNGASEQREYAGREGE